MISFEEAKRIGMQAGKTNGDVYDLACETEDAYVFGMKRVPIDNVSHAHVVMKESGELVTYREYSKGKPIKVTKKPFDIKNVKTRRK